MAKEPHVPKEAAGGVKKPAAKSPNAPKTATPSVEAPAKTVQVQPPPDNNATQALMQETMALDMAQTPVDSEPDSTPPPAPAAPEKTASMLGDFKLLKKLGQGGMGAVYKAHQISLDRVVAVKVLAKELTKKKEFVTRFQREAKAMAKLDHPNVLRCFSVDKDPVKGLHFIAMEFVEGGSVEGWLKKLGRFEIGDALHIVLKTAHALQHAHENSLIHRDIKPDNLLLTKNGVVKVADLGLAKDTDEDVSLTKSGAGAGTPIYMAPEQAYNVKHVDCRVDIYALGVMLYVFLTGQPPFQGNTPIELIMAKEKGKFDPMRKHNDEVPSKLDLIVDKMLSKKPELRYASCTEVIDQLEPLGLANEQLRFLGLELAVKRETKSATTHSPQTPAKGTMKPTGGATKMPAPSVGKTGVDEAETVVKDVWHWNMVTKEGKVSTKKVTTDQMKSLIKTGHIDNEAQLSKTAKSGFRAAATFMEFHGLFKSKETTGKANVKGQKYRDMYKDIEAADARRRRWGWLGKRFKSVGGTIVGLLWIALILGLAGGGGYFLYTQVIAP